MSIVTSIIERESELLDGSKRVQELHTDSAGLKHVWAYTAASGANTATELAGHANALATLLAELEADQVTQL